VNCNSSIGIQGCDFELDVKYTHIDVHRPFSAPVLAKRFLRGEILLSDTLLVVAAVNHVLPRPQGQILALQFLLVGLAPRLFIFAGLGRPEFPPLAALNDAGHLLGLALAGFVLPAEVVRIHSLLGHG
jgi:hypothetical protein